jgi:ring-1,2-phenylacetyl-CoA epoxidase subunit PaaE
MANNFHKLRIKKIIKETPDCVSLNFDVPPLLKEKYVFKSGQYITLSTHINGSEVRRSYSLCSSPHEGELKVAIKKVEGGLFSTYANDILKENDELDVMLPTGNFILPNEILDYTSVIFYCAGSGITPILSIIKTILHSYPHINIILYYGNKNTESIIFKEEIEGLKNIYLNRVSIHYILSKEMLSSPLFYGRINREKCEKFEKIFKSKNAKCLYYLCGPASMIFEVKDTLIEHGVKKEQILFELFNTDGIQEKTLVKKNEVTGTKLKVMLDGLEFDIIYETKHGNILDAALANGADLPYACKGGVCSTCKAKCENGQVSMIINYALEPEEIENGYVLTCQAYPTSEDVYINFDN